jgi:hypothetical protein
MAAIDAEKTDRTGLDRKRVRIEKRAVAFYDQILANGQA